MTAAGVTPDDVVQIAFGYGLFTGAFGLHYGSEAIGAAVIPMGGGNTEKADHDHAGLPYNRPGWHSQLCLNPG